MWAISSSSSSSSSQLDEIDRRVRRVEDLGLRNPRSGSDLVVEFANLAPQSTNLGRLLEWLGHRNDGVRGSGEGGSRGGRRRRGGGEGGVVVLDLPRGGGV